TNRCRRKDRGKLWEEWGELCSTRRRRDTVHLCYEWRVEDNSPYHLLRVEYSSVFVFIQSGRAQPRSKTLRELRKRPKFRQVLECGCALPLWSNDQRKMINSQ